MANNNLHYHGHCHQKWPPRNTQKATHPVPMQRVDRRGSLKQVGMLFSCIERVYDPQNTPMARRDSSPSSPHHWSILRAIPSHHQRKAYLPAQGLLSIDLMRKHSKLYFVCGSRGPFTALSAMVVMTVVVGHWWLISSGRLAKLGSDQTIPWYLQWFRLPII
jgi:hypothetical protein